MPLEIAKYLVDRLIDYDHGDMNGLADDDHIQYLLLAGRSGGQTAIGGTGSGDDLILQSTSHATKGIINLNDGTVTYLRLSGNRANSEDNQPFGELQWYNSNAVAQEIIGRIELVEQDNFGRRGKFRLYTKCDGVEYLGISVTDVGHVGINVDEAEQALEINGSTLYTPSTDSPGSTSGAMVFGPHGGPYTIVFRRTATDGDFMVDVWTGSAWDTVFGIDRSESHIMVGGIIEAMDSGHIQLLSADNGFLYLSNVLTDTTTKVGRMVVPHYDNSEEPLYVFGAASVLNNNYVAFGGGSSLGNAATQIDFYTAATSTTQTGTPRTTIISSGFIGMGTQTPATLLELESEETLVGAQADDYAACLTLDPGYTGAYTVTRHNYIDVQNPSLGGGAAVTDAAIFRFDAAIGTHKVLAAAFQTTDSNGDTTNWAGGVKINVNGTLYKMPLIAV